MKRLLKHQTLFILLFSVKLFSQNPIFIPASESALMFINPSLSGFDYKNRIAYNQLIESHPNGNIHSMNLGYYFDIPKLDLISHGKTEASTSKLFSLMLGGRDKVQKDDSTKEVTN